MVCMKHIVLTSKLLDQYRLRSDPLVFCESSGFFYVEKTVDNFSFNLL